MKLEEIFSQKLKEIDDAGLTKQASAEQEIELLPNRFAELDVGRPFYLENAIVAQAEEQKYDLKQLHEAKQATEPEDLIEKAHPKSIYLSDALGDGGLLENQNEQHEKMKEVVNKMPTGNHVHIYAQIIQDLVKLANEAELESPAAAEIIDNTIAALTGQESLAPVEASTAGDMLKKKAFWPLAAAIIAGVGAAGYGIYRAIRGIQERLDTDTKDLLDNIAGWKNEPEYASVSETANQMYNAASQLNALSTALMTATAQAAANPSAEASQHLDQIDQQFSQFLEQFKTGFDQIKHELPGDWWTAVDGHLETVEQDYHMLQAQAEGASSQDAAHKTTESNLPGYEEAKQHLQPQAPVAAPRQADPVRIKAIQQYLAQNGFGPLAATGQPDDTTKEKLDEFETYINRSEMTEQGLRVGLGVSNLPGNRLASLLDSSLTADQLHALAEVFHNPGAAVAAEQ